MSYFRCPKCGQLSHAKKCLSCKVSVVNASYLFYIMRVGASYLG